MHLPAAGGLANHVRCRRLRLEHRALQVCVDDVIEVCFGHLFGPLLAIEAYRVHEDVEVAEMLRDVVH